MAYISRQKGRPFYHAYYTDPITKKWVGRSTGTGNRESALKIANAMEAGETPEFESPVMKPGENLLRWWNSNMHTDRGKEAISKKISAVKKWEKENPEAALAMRRENVKHAKRGFAEWRAKNPHLFSAMQSKKGIEATRRIGSVAERQRAKDPKAYEGWLHHPQTGRTAMGVDNCFAILWRLRSPKGIIYEFKNLNEFVRANPNLFEPEWVRWCARPHLGDQAVSKGCLRCIAVDGLQKLHPNKKTPRLSWHGWTWVSVQEHTKAGVVDLINRTYAP